MYRKTFTGYRGDREKGSGVSFSTTNMRSVSEKTGVGYHNLVRVFTRERRVIWDSAPGGWLIIKSEIYERGKGKYYGGNFKNR